MTSNFSSREFRDALGCFATGVTIVTTTVVDNQKNIPLGMTVNSFASVSLEPPLVLWSLAKDCASYDAFAKADRYNIHVLTETQQNLSDRFATAEQDKYQGVNWSFDDHGVPLISQCKAVFQCQQHSLHEGGDHLIIVGRVCQLSGDDGSDALIFAQGHYHKLQP